MNKSCAGCGIKLQNINKDEVGFTPNLDFDFCVRCFKLKNYGQNIKDDIKIDNDDILKLLENDDLKLFLTDFLNISEEVMDTFKKVKGNKILIISKADLLPDNIHEQRFIANIKKTYNLNCDIYLESKKSNLDELKSLILKEKNVYVCGYTISGKSTFINKLTGSQIVESKMETTTLDLIKTKLDDTNIYDTPGFIYKYYYKGIDYLRRIKPAPRSMASGQELVINDVIIKSNVDNNLVLYIPSYLQLKKRFSKSELKVRINVPEKSDVVIKGMGFVKFNNSCILETNIDKNFIEVRDSLIGKRYE